MNIAELLQSIPYVKVILSDEQKTICSVSITIERMETINSGSMVFSHARYLTFGQLVVFSGKDVTDDQAGALFFNVTTPEEVMDVIENIETFIPHEKTAPEDSIIIKENDNGTI